MPIYEYRCARCSEVFEAFQKITDKPLTKCKFCNGKVDQLISHSSFQLKGSGWYLSDYARKSGSPKAPGDKDSKVSGKSEVKGDSKSSD